jgi:integrase
MRYYLYREVIGIESPHTARAKVYDLHKFLVFFKLSKGDEDISLWDKALTNSFVEALQDEYGIPSIYRIFATLTNFTNFLILREAIKPVNNPTDGIRLSNRELPPAQGVQLQQNDQPIQSSSEEVHEILLSAAQSFVEGKLSADKKTRTLPYRDKAIVSVLYNTGLRVDELCSLTMAQVELIPGGGLWFRDVKCKGKKIRKAYLKQEAVEVLNAYIGKERGRVPGFIFTSWRGQKLNQPDIWRILRRIADRAQESLPAGTTIKIHPHSMRHERGFNLHRAGLGDAMIAEQLGHSGTGQVARYSRRSESDEVEMLKDI